MAQAELFWGLLEDGELEDMKKLKLEDFNWSACNPRSGSTILMAAIESGMTRNHTEALKKIEWLVSQGASIPQECQKDTDYSVFWPANENDTKIVVNRKGHTVVTYLLIWRRNLKGKDEWSKQYEYLGNVWKSIASATQGKEESRVLIHEGIVELWEKSLSAKASHDLTIEAADGRVTAHAHMLKEASSVVRAMLESPMKEGTAQRIEVKDTPTSAVSLILEIIYTCSAQSDPDYETALQALDLAHRWQVDVVVGILADLLSSKLTDKSFATIAEQAILKGLEKLKLVVQSYGAESTAVQNQLKKGCLPAAVAQLFPSSKAEPKRKRKRL